MTEISRSTRQRHPTAERGRFPASGHPNTAFGTGSTVPVTARTVLHMVTSRTRDVLWSDVEDVYAAILAHPFLAGLADGSLPRESFRHYIVQDAHYLRGYAKALAVCAAKAPDEDGTVMFAKHAAGAIAAERDLHAALMGEMGSSPEDAAKEPVAPTTQAYVSYLLASAYGGSFAEAVNAKGPRIVVFEVGGVIDFGRKELDIREPFLTIAGQTAPSPGITIIRGGLNLHASDVIIRHIRVKTGADGAAKRSGWEADAFTTVGRDLGVPA